MTMSKKNIIGAFAPACSFCYDECEFCYYAEGCMGFDNPNLAPVRVTPEVIAEASNPENKIVLVYEGGEF